MNLYSSIELHCTTLVFFVFFFRVFTSLKKVIKSLNNKFTKDLSVGENLGFLLGLRPKKGRPGVM